VINVAGPQSSKTSLMAGVSDEMTISIRALRQEVPFVPSQKRYDFETSRMIVSDRDTSLNFRPKYGNHIVICPEDPTAIRIIRPRTNRLFGLT
jgi:hypothetical protein